MWKSAVARYEAIAGVQVQQLAKAENVAQILKDIDDKEAKFTTHRHDGSKLDKFRSLVSQSLAPIQSIADIVAQATKTASLSTLQLYLNLILCLYSPVIGLPSK
jgi:hypothetical protein